MDSITSVLRREDLAPRSCSTAPFSNNSDVSVLNLFSRVVPESALSGPITFFSEMIAILCDHENHFHLLKLSVCGRQTNCYHVNSNVHISSPCYLSPILSIKLKKKKKSLQAWNSILQNVPPQANCCTLTMFWHQSAKKKNKNNSCQLIFTSESENKHRFRLSEWELICLNYNNWFYMF